MNRPFSTVRSFLKKGQTALVAAGLLSSLVFAAVPSASALPFSAAGAVPRVSFTFDDGFASSVRAAEIMQTYGLTGTAYVTTGFVGTTNAATNSDFMTWEQVCSLQNNFGWEVGAHTINHPELTLATPEVLEQELANSQQALKNNGVCEIDAVSFATPFGAYDNNVLAAASRYYSSHRGFHNIGYNDYLLRNSAAPPDYYSDRLLNNQQVQIGGFGESPAVTVEQAKAYIDAALPGQWLVLTFHDITETELVPANEDQAYTYPANKFEEIVAYAASKVTANTLNVINVRDGLLTGTNLLTDGDFAGGLGGWTTDDATNIAADSQNHGSYPEPANSVSLKSSPTANPNAASGNSHLFSPQVPVSFGQEYLIKNYLNFQSGVNGAAITFYIDEYAGDTWISGSGLIPGLTYSTAEGVVNVANVNFAYTPTSNLVTSARLQIIVPYAQTIQAYVDDIQWLSDGVAPAPKPGDANGDGLVNIKDAALVSLNWGKTGMTLAQGDLNGDGTVNIKDAALISLNWSK